jgi:P4 family phage/plasmid primase-like protien
MTDNPRLLKDAIAALTIPMLWQRLRIPGTPKIGNNRSPLRDDDQNESFSIFDDGRRAKDHGTGWTGDSFDFYQAVTKTSAKLAFVFFVQLAGLGRPLNGNQSTTVAFDWATCKASVTKAKLAELAAWRGFSESYCQTLFQANYIGLHNTNWVFPVTDPNSYAIVGCHELYDMENKKWKFDPKGTKAWPLIVGKVSTASEVHLLESTWDGLALREQLPMGKVSVVITRGALQTAKVRSLDIPKDAKVYAWPQNDQPRENGLIPSEQWFAGIQRELGRDFYRVQTPKQYQDLNDWTRAGAKLEELQQAIEVAEPVTPKEESPINGDKKPAPLNEVERVALLEAKLPPILVWEKNWYAFQEGFWQRTDRDIYRPLALETMPESSRTAKKAKETLDHLEGLRQLKTDIFRDANRFDGNDILLNIFDGVLRIRPDGTTKKEEASKEHHFSAKIPCIYDPKAPSPLFVSALVQALPDPVDQELFLLWSASVLIPNNDFEAALCCYGPGGSGKSTLAMGVQSALGLQVTRFLTMKEICSEKGYEVPMLQRAMLNISTELDAVAIETSERFKRLISGEEVMARNIFGRPFIMSTRCKFLFLTNHLPRFKGGTGAELRRLRFLRFNKKIEDVDTTLKAKITLERNGIFRLLVDYLALLLKLKAMPHGGADSQETLNRFAVTNDAVGSFVAEVCVLDPDESTPKAELANRFNAYLDKIGLPSALGDNFFKLLYDRYPFLTASRPRIGQTRENIVGGIKVKSVTD